MQILGGWGHGGQEGQEGEWGHTCTFPFSVIFYHVIMVDLFRFICIIIGTDY